MLRHDGVLREIHIGKIREIRHADQISAAPCAITFVDLFHVRRVIGRIEHLCQNPLFQIKRVDLKFARSFPQFRHLLGRPIKILAEVNQHDIAVFSLPEGALRKSQQKIILLIAVIRDRIAAEGDAPLRLQIIVAVDLHHLIGLLIKVVLRQKRGHLPAHTHVGKCLRELPLHQIQFPLRIGKIPAVFFLVRNQRKCKPDEIGSGKSA